MKTPPHRIRSIRDRLNNSGDCSRRFLWSAAGQLCLSDLMDGTTLNTPLAELAGRSILLATRDQLAAAAALMELDGIARRIVVCPPDIPEEHFPSVIANAGIDVVVSDYELNDRHWAGKLRRVACGCRLLPLPDGHPEYYSTEWVLLTSGTSGAPKTILHTLDSLIAPIDLTRNIVNENHPVWGTFYDIRRYGGLQVFLRAMLGPGSLVLSSAGEPVADHLARLAGHGVTHLSGTPSHWRRALMSPAVHAIAPRYVRLSGEIVDQAILNTLHSFFPDSVISHAFASTEAGVAFEVDDGLAGFPASMLSGHGDVEMRIRSDSLQIRSNRAASRYMDPESGVLADEEGFVDTGDIVELRGDRYYFLGRRNGVVNVGGLKVYPEEIEAVINSHPAVRMSLVRPRRNSFTGALVSADVVLGETANEPDSPLDFKRQILEICAQKLPPHKIPATIRCVPSLTVAAGGKLVRRCA